MKKPVLTLIALLLVLSLVGCTSLSDYLSASTLLNAPVAQTEPTEAPTQPSPKTKVIVSPTSKKTIGLDAAKSAAFKHAEVKSKNARDLDIELNNENGIKQYEITFEAGGYEYDYDIDAYTGKVIRHEKERND